MPLSDFMNSSVGGPTWLGGKPGYMDPETHTWIADGSRMGNRRAAMPALRERMNDGGGHHGGGGYGFPRPQPTIHGYRPGQGTAPTGDDYIRKFGGLGGNSSSIGGLDDLYAGKAKDPFTGLPLRSNSMDRMGLRARLEKKGDFQGLAAIDNYQRAQSSGDPNGIAGAGEIISGIRRQRTEGQPGQSQSTEGGDNLSWGDNLSGSPIVDGQPLMGPTSGYGQDTSWGDNLGGAPISPDDEMAKGGRPKPLKSYLVGEKGPEEFVGKSGDKEMIGTQGPEMRSFPESGRVIPNNKLPLKMRMMGAREDGGQTAPSQYGIALPAHLKRDPRDTEMVDPYWKMRSLDKTPVNDMSPWRLGEANFPKTSREALSMKDGEADAQQDKMMETVIAARSRRPSLTMRMSGSRAGGGWVDRAWDSTRDMGNSIASQYGIALPVSASGVEDVEDYQMPTEPIADAPLRQIPVDPFAAPPRPSAGMSLRNRMSNVPDVMPLSPAGSPQQGFQTPYGTIGEVPANRPAIRTAQSSINEGLVHDQMEAQKLGYSPAEYERYKAVLAANIAGAGSKLGKLNSSITPDNMSLRRRMVDKFERTGRA